MKILKDKVTVALSDQDFEDVVDTAGYGIVYWCHKAIVDSESQQYTVMWWDNDELNSCTLTKTHLENVWAKIIQGDFQVHPMIRRYFDSDDIGDIDAEAGDILIQFAVFGKIVYG